MNTYIFSPVRPTDKLTASVNTQEGNAYLSIPFDDGNTHCAQFVQDWHDGAEVTNADGTVAPYSDAAVRTLGLTPPDDPKFARTWGVNIRKGSAR